MKHARSDYDHIQEDNTGPYGRAPKIPHDEPVFLIRGQDIVGADAVEMWATLAEAAGADAAIVQSAREHAEKMRAWPKKKMPDMPDNG